ncbi:hypothetical protein GCM10010387_14640 [Streptomyces inusitatus]|uniref:Uncharacterized protein n=1 Tax=Streptomyces inusitatus TaxID=68221 RepID=A0A918PTP1_9ACTN|nr:hypothetical protein [Streptomyces inusitatus]GGZ22512.1 hypothetical protein GCM10010387_14640 [Streptomyces inusitatus]
MTVRGRQRGKQPGATVARGQAGGGDGWTTPATRLTLPYPTAPPLSGGPIANGSATPAVLYICVERSPDAPGLAEERAVEEGHSFAEQRALRILAEITDPYGEPDPARRTGWLRVRAMAEDGAVSVVIVRWPNAISPVSALRQGEITWFRELGVRVLFSWAPLAARKAEGW